ncbi:helix-turn-helix domain-containing protein [Corynebacterium dentalis]|uniref:helix-turn-helix domain-containing protein n=1 Tax=Corynebacterium dentalis TaxID=2014528 RepID=UPI0028995CAA|nr:helix-turn-helix domain-containing protein [Corynebacterium dentalis]
MEKVYISPTEGQQRTGIHADTIREACRRGDLKASKRGMGRNAHWRIKITDLDAWTEGVAA